MKGGANSGNGAKGTARGVMEKKPAESRAREASAERSEASPSHARKARSQAEADAVARAVLEALSAYEPL
jgi:hypothetical protein